MPAKLLTRLIHHLEIKFDHLKSLIPGKAPVHIRVYFCFGSPRVIFLKGRILEGKRILPVTAQESLWVNIFNTFQRFESDEIPFAQLRLSYQGQEQFITADEEGYFEAWFDLSEMSVGELATLRIRLEMLEPVRPGQPQPVIEVCPTIIPLNTHLGLISDIDDTVIRTDVFQPFKMLINLLFKSFRSRQSFIGTAALYRALSAGLMGQDNNPVFYASTSPWNLFDLLVEYFRYQCFPPNPILYLRDWGITENEILPVDNFDHKKRFIQIILELFPQTQFILVGDSGQQDPEIYAGVAEDNPGRILAIYLREVTGSPQRIESIHRLRPHLVRQRVPVILAESVAPMAEHAAGQGWISPEAASQISEQARSKVNLMHC
jgi:phosphatidate phosphatase APP1